MISATTLKNLLIESFRRAEPRGIVSKANAIDPK